jgi:ATP-dependent Lon protease
VGGIKHKLLAAYRAEITDVVLPKENLKDLEEIPAEVRDGLRVHAVESMDEVLRVALDREIGELPPSEGKFEKAAAESPVESGSVAH